MLLQLGIGLTIIPICQASLLGLHPFALAYFSAIGQNIGIFALMLLFSAGLLLSGVKTELWYYLCAALIYTLFTKLRPNAVRPVKALISGAAIAVCGAVNAIIANTALYGIFLCIAEGILTALMHCVYARAAALPRRRHGEDEPSHTELICAAITAATLLSGLSWLRTPFGLSLTGALLSWFALTLAYECETGIAAGSAVCMGFVCAMGSAEAVGAAGFYGLCAAAGSLMKRCGRMSTAFGYLGAGAAGLIYMQYAGFGAVSLFDLMAGALLFLLTPKRLQKSLHILIAQAHSSPLPYADERIRMYAAARLDGAAKAYASLGESLMRASNERLENAAEQAGDLIDSAARSVCANCPRSVQCWERDFEGTYADMLNILGACERGEIRVSEGFARRCNAPIAVLNAIERECEMQRLHELWRAESLRLRDLCARQYADIAKTFAKYAKTAKEGVRFQAEVEDALIAELKRRKIEVDELSVFEIGEDTEVHVGALRADIKAVEAAIESVTGMRVRYCGREGMQSLFSSAPVMGVESAVYSAVIGDNAAVEGVAERSGDSVEVFAVGGMSYVLLCDGMGTGRGAKRSSREFARLLRRFLESGFGAEEAIESVNSALCLRLDGEESVSADVLCVDCLHGVARLYKAGGAQTLIVSGTQVQSVYAGAPAVGILPQTDIQAAGFRLVKGDMLVLASDGVTEAGARVYKEWVTSLIYGEAKGAAQRIISKALEADGGIAYDDMSAAVLRVV